MVIKRRVPLKEKSINGVVAGGILRKKREEYNKKWTIPYVAEQANIDEDHLQKIETGKTANPYYDTIGKIADVLDLNKEELWQEYSREKAKYSSED